MTAKAMKMAGVPAEAHARVRCVHRGGYGAQEAYYAWLIGSWFATLLRIAAGQGGWQES